ncbi:MAG: hypothetical protein GY896_05250 [Gammaproteobacteria bacterium]|nr:hypothetical protein [Gammaproteobacteria bacterium]
MFYHRSENGIALYYNGRVHELPEDREILEQLRQLCEHRQWPGSLIDACIEIEPLKVLLIELASNGAILLAED